MTVWGLVFAGIIASPFLIMGVIGLYVTFLEEFKVSIMNGVKFLLLSLGLLAIGIMIPVISVDRLEDDAICEMQGGVMHNGDCVRIEKID